MLKEYIGRLKNGYNIPAAIAGVVANSFKYGYAPFVLMFAPKH